MRKTLIAGNWKMNKTAEEASSLIDEMLGELSSIDSVDSIICPPFTSLDTAHKLLKGINVGLGAQNMHFEESGAFTGEISPLMVKELCSHVIIGHSERRQYFCETDDIINKKVKAAFAYGIKPIVCVGENLEQNEAGETKAFIEKQIRLAFDGISDLGDAIVAYEPIWAIGTGKAASAEDAGFTAKHIRSVINDLYGAEAASNLRILYGGSVKPSNIKEFILQEDIDGALVGGASLQADSFINIVKACA